MAVLPTLTELKFHDFAITKILREIDVWDSISAESAVLTHFEPLKFDFYEFFHFFKAEMYQINKS